MKYRSSEEEQARLSGGLKRLENRRARFSKRQKERRNQHLAFLRRKAGRRRVVAPQTFELETPKGRAEFVSFLAELRDYSLTSPGPRVLIDFSRTERMTPAATLLFTAELSRIQALSAEPITCNYPNKKLVAQVLQQVGVFAMLNQTKKCRITAKNVKSWKFDSGSEVLGETIAKALSRYEKLFDEPKHLTLYRALEEAQTNCVHHAYTEPRGDGHPSIPNWWMFSQYQDRRLVVAICDLGMGIPRSLPTGDHWKWVRRLMFFRRWTDHDGHRIRAAMELGVSRTKKRNRGKGLHEMRSVLDGLNGRMHIHSNCGYYTYDARRKTELCSNFKQTESILGTILLWSVPTRQEAP